MSKDKTEISNDWSIDNKMQNSAVLENKYS